MGGWLGRKSRPHCQWRGWATCAALALLVGACRPAAAAVPTISLGSGQSMIVEYDLNFVPLRKYVGLQKPVDITPLADGTFLLVDEGSRTVTVFTADGGIAWSEQIGDYPLRARPRPDGGFLVTSGDRVIAIRADRSVEWERPVRSLRAAVPLANGNVLIAANNGNGWLTEMKLDGTVVWQSKPRGYVTASGRWIDEDPDQYFQSMYSLDVGADGTVFTTDFDRHVLRVLSREYRNLRTIPGLHHVTDTRIGPRGELVAVSAEDFLVRVELPDGTSKSLRTNLRPYCANISRTGTLLVGLVWEPEREVLNATAARNREAVEVPWYRSALPLPILGALFGLVVAFMMRWPEVRHGGRAEASAAEPPAEVGTGEVRTPPAAPAARGGRWRAAAKAGAVCVGVAALGGGSYLAWTGIVQVEAGGFSHGFWRFILGCVIAGVALRALNAIAGSAGTLTSFSSERALPPRPRPGRLRLAALVVLSLGSIGACMYLLFERPEEQAAAIALWLAAQVWIVAAAFPALPADGRDGAARRYVRPLLALLLLAAIVTRFWQIGYYPDHIHHDHGIYGDAALRTLREDWKPFFIMDPWSAATVSRPWLVPCIAALELFGVHYWVLRLTGAISGVVLVWGTYLLGTSLFNRRVGLIAGLLVTVNHSLLVYSRQPYVIDSAALFVVCLHCAVVGLKRGCRFHWCLAGVLGAWSMLTVKSFTTFPFIGAALFVFFLCVYPRWVWRNRTGLLWMVAGACIAYLPMLEHMVDAKDLYDRLRSTGVFLNPDGSIRWDFDLWAYQVGRSFGSIIYYTDASPWFAATPYSICMRYGACLFGIGLTYLLASWRVPATFVLVGWATIGIFLGSAMLMTPPTVYHFLAAIVPLMLVSAVALDRFLAPTDRWPPVWRVPPWLAVLALLGVIGATHLDAVWQKVRRPPPSDDGRTVYRANALTLAVRFVREHPQYRHYLVRSPTDVTCADAAFLFFAADSDVSDLTSDLEHALPVPPVDPAVGVSFIVLPSRTAHRYAIPAVYPGARADEQLFYPDPGSLWVYLVDAGTVRETYQAARPARPPVDPSAPGG